MLARSCCLDEVCCFKSVICVTVEIIVHVISHRYQRGGKHPFCCSFVRMGGGVRGVTF